MACGISLSQKCGSSPATAVALVYATLMLDNMLLTVVVPILPEYFYTEKLNNISVGFPEPSSEEQQAYGEENANSTCMLSSQFGLLLDENMYIAFLFAAKPFVQMLANILVGPLTDQYGFHLPMIFGYLILFTSSLLFAFGENYATLMFARALQGVGSACGATAGIAMVASEYTDDEERGKMIGIALGGLAMGVLFGPIFGSTVYQFCGKEAPFIILSALSLILVAVLLLTRNVQLKNILDKSKVNDNAVGAMTLIKDPYIIITILIIMLGNLSITILEAGQPIWMMQTMCATKWMLGFAFLPESVSYLIGTNLVGWFGYKIGRYIVCLAGLISVGVSSIAIPFSTNVWMLWLPGSLLGFGISMVDASVFPIMGRLVDTRHGPAYGRIYAMADGAYSAAFFIGPMITGISIHASGFKNLMIGVGVIIVLFAPTTIFLKNPPEKILQNNDRTAILNEEGTSEPTPNYDSINQ